MYYRGIILGCEEGYVWVMYVSDEVLIENVLVSEVS